MATVQDYLTFNLDNPNTLPFIDLLQTLIPGMNKIDKYNFLTPQDIVDIYPTGGTFNPDPGNPDHIKTMCTIYRYVMVRLYCFFQSSALGLRGAIPNGAPITLSDDIIFTSSGFTSSGGGVRISRPDFFKSINDYFILRMDLDRMGKPGQVISRRNTIPPGFYNVLLNNVKKNDYKPYGRHILGNVIKNFQSGNVVTGAMGPSTEYVFACTQRDHIDVYEDYIYNCINLISNVEYNAGKQIYSFGIGYILSPGNTGCAVNVCAFIGIFTLAMILYILREHSNFFTSSNGTNESMLLNTHSLLNTCNMISGPTGGNFATTNNMYLYKFTLNTSIETQRAVSIGGSGQPGVGTSSTIPFQPYSPANPLLQLDPIFLEPVIAEIKQLAGQTVQKQIELWNRSGSGPFTSIIKVLGRFLPKYDSLQNNGIPEYKHLWGHCYGIYIHIINKRTPVDILNSLLFKYGITSIPNPNIIDVPPSDYCFLISIAEPYFSRGLISYEPTFIQPNKFKVPYLQLNSPYVNNFLTPISISNSPECDSLYLPIKLLDTLTLRTLLDLQYYSDCRCYTSIEFQFVLNKPNTKTETVAIVSYTDLRKVHSSCGGVSSLVIQSEYLTPALIKLNEYVEDVKKQNKQIKATKHWGKIKKNVGSMERRVIKLWKNYTSDKSQFPKDKLKLDQDFDKTIGVIRNEEQNLFRFFGSIQGILNPALLYILDFAMSMFGSYNSIYANDRYRMLGFPGLACDIDVPLLNPANILSINIDDLNETPTESSFYFGGSTQKNMKGGGDFINDLFINSDEYIKQASINSQESGKANMIQYVCSNTPDTDTILVGIGILKSYNSSLYNYGHQLVLTIPDVESYNKLFVIDKLMSSIKLNISYKEMVDNIYENVELSSIINGEEHELLERIGLINIENSKIEKIVSTTEYLFQIFSKGGNIDEILGAGITQNFQAVYKPERPYVAKQFLYEFVTPAIDNPRFVNALTEIQKRQTISQITEYLFQILSKGGNIDEILGAGITQKIQAVYNPERPDVAKQLLYEFVTSTIDNPDFVDAFAAALTAIQKTQCFIIPIPHKKHLELQMKDPRIKSQIDQIEKVEDLTENLIKIAEVENIDRVIGLEPGTIQGVYKNEETPETAPKEAEQTITQIEIFKDKFKEFVRGNKDTELQREIDRMQKELKINLLTESLDILGIKPTEVLSDIDLKIYVSDHIEEIESLINNTPPQKVYQLTDILLELVLKQIDIDPLFGIGYTQQLIELDDVVRIKQKLLHDISTSTNPKLIPNIEFFIIEKLLNLLYNIIISGGNIDQLFGRGYTKQLIKLSNEDLIKQKLLHDISTNPQHIPAIKSFIKIYKLTKTLYDILISKNQSIIIGIDQLFGIGYTQQLIELDDEVLIKQKLLNDITRNPQLIPKITHYTTEFKTLSGGGTRRKHHNKRKTIKRKKNRKTYKKRLHKNRKRRRTHKG